MATIGRRRKKKSGYVPRTLSGQSKSNRNVYDTQRWRNLREVKKKRRQLTCKRLYGIDAPLCEIETRGLTKQEVQVGWLNGTIHEGCIADHIQEVNDGGSIWDLNNIQWISKRSHETKNVNYKNRLYNPQD